MIRNILGIPVETLVGPIAAHLAHMDDNTQKIFFSTFADEMRKACQTHHLLGMQCAFISQTLTDEQREVYSSIGFSKSKDSTP